MIRLIQARRSNCPICRGAIIGAKLNLKLHLALFSQHFDDYENRHTVELESGIYDIPINWNVQLEARLALIARLKEIQEILLELQRARQN